MPVVIGGISAISRPEVCVTSQVQRPALVTVDALAGDSQPEPWRSR